MMENISIEQKMRFFGTNSTNVKNKYNIFIGISISNKKMNFKIASDYINWAIKNTKEKVAVIIADELNIVNYRLLDGYSTGKAQNRAKTVGNNIENIFRTEIQKLPEKQQQKIHIYKWSDVKKDLNYQKLFESLQNEINNNTELRTAAFYFIKKYIHKRGKIITDEKIINELATYIIGELPTLLQGIYINKDYYQLCVYPTYFSSGMSQFVMDIHGKELLVSDKIYKLIKTKAILVECWLD